MGRSGVRVVVVAASSLLALFKNVDEGSGDDYRGGEGRSQKASGLWMG
jgi:hypothetical protein